MEEQVQAKGKSGFGKILIGIIIGLVVMALAFFALIKFDVIELKKKDTTKINDNVPAKPIINIKDNKDYKSFNTITKEITLNGEKHVLTSKQYTDKGHAYFLPGELNDGMFNFLLEEVYLDNTLINSIRVSGYSQGELNDKTNIKYKIIKGIDNKEYLAIITPEIYGEDIYDYSEEEELKDAKIYYVVNNLVVNIFNDKGLSIYKGLTYYDANQLLTFKNNEYKDGILVNFYDNYFTNVKVFSDGSIADFKFTIDNDIITQERNKTYNESDVTIEGASN